MSNGHETEREDIKFRGCVQTFDWQLFHRLGIWLPRYSAQQVFYSVLLLDRSLFSECFTMFLSTISVSLELFAAISEWFVCLQYESHIMCTIE